MKMWKRGGGEARERGNGEASKDPLPHILTHTLPLMLLLLLTPVLLSGSSPGDDEDRASSSRESEFTPTEGEDVGEFFAEVEIRDDLLAVDEYMMQVQVHPVKTAWPQTQIPRTAFAADLRVLIKLRGVSVPRITSSRDRPMVETRRETIRFDEAMRFVWHLMAATDHLILSDPEVVSGTEMVMCDVYFELAGTRLSLAEALVVAGHAKYEPHDWGKRIVQRGADENKKLYRLGNLYLRKEN